MKTCLCSLLTFAMLVTPVFAGGHDLSGVRCEDPAFVKFIKDTLPTMKSENGTPFFTQMGSNSNLSPKTVSTSKTTVICAVAVEVKLGGTSQRVRGRFTYQEFANGKASVTWAPYY